MTYEEITRTFNAVNLYVNGKFDAEKYHFKASVPKNWTKKIWVEKFIETQYDARVFAASCIHSGVQWWGLQPDSVVTFKEWKKRILNPSLAIEDIANLGISSLEVLVKDSTTGPPLLNFELSGRIHFVTFVYLLLTTHAHLHWTSLNWKVQRDKHTKLLKTIDIDSSLVIQFAKLLRQHT